MADNQFKQWFDQDFTEKIEIRHSESVMFTGDDQGTIVGVHLYDNGTPYSGGGTVNGFVKRIDGGVVVINGTLSGNAASIILPAAALAYAGPIGVQITLTQGGQVTTILKVIYSVDDTSGTPVDPGSVMPSLPELIAEANAAIAAMEATGQQVLASIPSDYTALSNDVYDFRRATNAAYVRSPDEPFTFIQGEYMPSSGTGGSRDYSIRLYGYLPDGVCKISCDRGYKFNVWAWSKTDESYVGHIQANGQFGKTDSFGYLTEYSIDFALNYHYSVTLYHTDNTANISPSDGSAFHAFLFTDKTLTMQNKAADAKETSDRINFLRVQKSCTFVQGEYAPSNGTVLTTTKSLRIYGMLPDDVASISCLPGYKFNIFAWNKADESYAGHIQADGTLGTASTYKFFTRYEFEQPHDYLYSITLYNVDASLDIAVSESTNFSAYANTDKSLTMPNKAADAQTVGDMFDALGIGNNLVTTADAPAFVGSPITIFANDGADAIANVDDGLLNAVSVVKVSDSLYYMYYEGFSATGGDDYSDINLCFAYSTDGEHFTKAIPSGITPPNPGTNILMSGGAAHGQCVVRVLDPDYPFRMIAIDSANANRIAKMWKSADGVNFVYLRQLTDGYNDSFVSCVVRGSLLKIFLRTRDGQIRTIGTIYTDIDGNRYNGAYNNQISLGSMTNQLYQASASLLDDRRELLLPTLYNPADHTEAVGCLILNGPSCKLVSLDTSAVMPSSIKSIYFASGLINIGRKTYAYYSAQNTDHDHLVIGTTKSAILRVEIAVS